jgi:hypothetical protein
MCRATLTQSQYRGCVFGTASTNATITVPYRSQRFAKRIYSGVGYGVTPKRCVACASRRCDARQRALLLVVVLPQQRSFVSTSGPCQF